MKSRLLLSLKVMLVSFLLVGCTLDLSEEESVQEDELVQLRDIGAPREARVCYAPGGFEFERFTCSKSASVACGYNSSNGVSMCCLGNETCTLSAY